MRCAGFPFSPQNMVGQFATYTVRAAESAAAAHWAQRVLTAGVQDTNDQHSSM